MGRPGAVFANGLLQTVFVFVALSALQAMWHTSPGVGVMARPIILDQLMPHGAGAPFSHPIVTINDLQEDFFLETNLVEGASLHLAANLRDPIPVRKFLAKGVADNLPSLTTSNLPTLLELFNISPTNEIAESMSIAVKLCESCPLPGEERACTTTLAQMKEFVESRIGGTVRLLATSGAPSESPAVKAPVTVASVKKHSLTEGKQIVICHNLGFPTQLFYCHLVKGTKVIEADLAVSDGSVINSVAICHMDTSMWLSRHPAFSALRIPKGHEACHFLVQNDLVFVPTSEKREKVSWE